jgi:stress-induced morphogen
MPTASELEERLHQAFPGAAVQVRDLTGTGDHFEARVVSETFRDKAMLEQHQLVYGALEAWLSTVSVHGLALVTEPPPATLSTGTEGRRLIQ